MPTASYALIFPKKSTHPILGKLPFCYVLIINKLPMAQRLPSYTKIGKKMKRIYAKLTSENNASIMSLLAAFLLGVLVTMSCHLLLF